MFDTTWAQPGAAETRPAGDEPWNSELNRDDVERSLFLTWSEHCVECAAPTCYEVCPLYVPRTDGECSRFVFGVYPNAAYSGHFDFGADIQFRRWGKLETRVGWDSFAIAPRAHARFATLPRRPRMALGWVVHQSQRRRGRLEFDDMVIECFSPNPDPFQLIVEYFVYLGPFEDGIRETRARHAVTIEPGHNFATIPFAALNITDYSSAGHLYVYPEPWEPEKRLIFTWLDIVRYRDAAERRSSAPAPEAGVGKHSATDALAAPAAKVKCVAWDLDNTLWDGVHAESASEMRVRRGVIDQIKALDARGILQTVVSKNDHDAVWPPILELGIAEYFLSPAINWGQKSENLRQVADSLNLGLDTFALIDDSEFERNEVSAALPQVRVYDVDEVDGLLDRPEFEVPVTVEAKERRRSYIAESRRREIRASFSGEYDDFLRSCEMRMRLFRPCDPAEITRCWELLQRSNQLNLSGRRYERDAFGDQLDQPGVLAVGLECEDRFGRYGIVGFALASLGEHAPQLTDFALSCRVAQKRVEHAFFDWLRREIRSHGASELLATVRVTQRNGPVRRVLDELHFERVGGGGEFIDMRLDLSREITGGEVIIVKAEESLGSYVAAAAAASVGV